MITSFMNALTQLMTALPVLVAVILLLTCAGFGFFMIRLTKREISEENDEVSVVRRRDILMLACIGVNVLIIAYVTVVFFFFQFLVYHVDLLG